MTAHHSALLDLSTSPSANPDDDRELVGIPGPHAARYFRAVAGLSAIRMSVGEEEYAAISDQLMSRRVSLHGAMDARTHAPALAVYC